MPGLQYLVNPKQPLFECEASLADLHFDLHPQKRFSLCIPNELFGSVFSRCFSGSMK